MPHMVLYWVMTDSVSTKTAAELANGGKYKGNHGVFMTAFNCVTAALAC